MKLSPPTRPFDPSAPDGAGASTRRRLPPATAARHGQARRRFGVGRWYALLVLLPTLLAGAYYGFVAADMYESEARFVMRTRGGGGASMPGGEAGGRGGAMASIFAAARPGTEEARAVAAFIESHAAVQALRRELDIVAMWRRPEADIVSKLWWDNPPLEWLLWYFRRRVTTEYDIESGVLVLRSLAFRPDDAQVIAERMLHAAENLVNDLTQRSIADTLRVAQEDVTKAEARVVAARAAMTAFREREQALDPTRTAVGAMDNIGRLEASLAQARAELQEKRAFMRADNPQIQVLNNRVAALQQQIGTERGRVTRGDEALTQQVAAYERLDLERQFADRQLASATASLELARSEVVRQQVFLARIAEPSVPEWARYPKGAFNTLTIFVALTVLFGIGWLLVVSAREHAN
jgi:capsular polysaccharide transport system permease protein